MLMVKAVWLLNVLWLSTMLLLTTKSPVHPGDRLSLPDKSAPVRIHRQINHVGRRLGSTNQVAFTGFRHPHHDSSTSFEVC